MNSGLKILGSFIILLVIWLLLSWPAGEGERALDWQGVILGVVVSAAVAWFYGRLFSPELSRIFSPRRLFWAALYLPYFFWYCLAANFDVLYRVIHPRMPIRPGIVKVKTSLKSKAALTALSNSITLTPGTLTVDLAPAEDGGDTYLYVHWINVRDEDPEGATRLIVSRFERFLRRIFE